MNAGHVGAFDFHKIAVGQFIQRDLNPQQTVGRAPLFVGHHHGVTQRFQQAAGSLHIGDDHFQFLADGDFGVGLLRTLVGQHGGAAVILPVGAGGVAGGGGGLAQAQGAPGGTQVAGGGIQAQVGFFEPGLTELCAQQQQAALHGGQVAEVKFGFDFLVTHGVIFVGVD